MEKTQCEQLAGKYPGMLVLQLRGKFYNAFDDSAWALGLITGYKVKETSTGRAKCGFPSNALERVTGKLKDSGISYVILENGVPVDTWEGGNREKFRQLAADKGSSGKEGKIPVPENSGNPDSIPKTETIFLQGTGADLRNAMISLKGEIDRLTGLGITVRSVATEHENIPGQGCMVYAVVVCGGKE